MGSEKLVCGLISLFRLRVLLLSTSRNLVPHSNGITWAPSGVAKIHSEDGIENSCSVILIRSVQASAISDLETVLVVHDLLTAIGVDRFTIRINDRRILSGILEVLGLTSKTTHVLRCLDKTGKIPRDALVRELQEQGVSSASVDCLLSLGELAGSATDVLGELHKLVGESAVGTQGVEAVGALLSNVRLKLGLLMIASRLIHPLQEVLTITQALSSRAFLMNCLVLEVSVLVGDMTTSQNSYTKQSLPGVGASLGIDRLLAGLEELDKLKSSETPASIVLAYFDESHLGDYLRIAARLREHGLSVDFYPEPKKLGQQLKWAGKKGFQRALVVGSEEFKSGTAQLKDLATQQSINITWKGDLDLLADTIKNELGR
jgi:histidyl-tRNA synthetase